MIKQSCIQLSTLHFDVATKAFPSWVMNYALQIIFGFQASPKFAKRLMTVRDL